MRDPLRGYRVIMPKAPLALAALAVVVLSGCAAPAGSTAPPASTPASSAPPVTTPPPVATTPPPVTQAPPPASEAPPATQAPAPARTTLPRTGDDDGVPCTDVPDDKVQAILDGSKQGKLQPLTAAAVRSETGDWFVAVRVKMDGDEVVGVWQTKTIDQPSIIGSVNAMARTLTNWPDTGNNGARAQRDAEQCLR